MSIVGGGEGGGANRNVDLEFSFGRNFIHTECDWFLFIDIYFRLFLFSVVSLFLLFGVVISLMLYVYLLLGAVCINFTTMINNDNNT